MKVRLIEKRPAAAGVETFVFEPEQSVQWQPGFYWHLILPHDGADDRGTERWFTLSAAPFEGRPAITTRVDAHPLSSFKQALHELPEGTELEADAPEGDFVLDKPEGEYVFLAGGIGITPFRSILAQLGHEGQMPQVHLLYGTRTAEAIFRAELDTLAAKYPTLKITYLVEPERLSAETIKQYVADLVAPTFYVSGPEPMVEALDQELAGLGIPEDRVKNDFFPGYVRV